jgi:hypothetical protein
MEFKTGDRVRLNAFAMAALSHLDSRFGEILTISNVLYVDKVVVIDGIGAIHTQYHLKLNGLDEVLLNLEQSGHCEDTVPNSGPHYHPDGQPDKYA